MFDKMLQCPPRPLAMDRRRKASVELAPNCPRCASSDTKFCYYNNYSLSQPRYFCKACRRYWTKGGSLRNVPVGGGGRKNSRAKSAKLTPSERISMISHCRSQTTSDLPRDNTLGNSCSSDGNKTFPPTTGVSSIDLADVFAKFLNQNSCFDPLPDEVDSSFNLMNSFNPNHDSPAVQFPEENNMIECQRTSELAPDNLLIGGSPHVFSGEFGLNNKHDEERIPELTPEDYGLQQFVGVGDEIVEAALWSDSQAVPNFTLQQLQRQEQVPSADDHFTLYSNLLNDNWSSFVLPSYGVFPRP